MTTLFEQFLYKLATEDQKLLQKAMAVFKISQRPASSTGSKTDPDSKTIEHANAMRIVQLGESVKNLMRQGMLDKKEILSGDFTPRKLAEYRDNYAHPERLAEESFDFSAFFKHAPELLNKFCELKDKHPNNVDIASCEDALRHFSMNETISPTVWQDAENYSQVYKGGILENISEQGRAILDTQTDGMCSNLIRRRDFLSHVYHEHGKKTAEYRPTEQSAFSALEKCGVVLNQKQYMAEILGTRKELELQEIAFKWLTPNKEGTPQKSYSVGWRLVSSEISQLAKSGACLNHIAQLDSVLEIARKSPPEIQKYMGTNFPEGFDMNIHDSLTRLDKAAQNDFWMQKKNKTDAFKAVMEKIEEAHKFIVVHKAKDLPKDSMKAETNKMRHNQGPVPSRTQAGNFLSLKMQNSSKTENINDKKTIGQLVVQQKANHSCAQFANNLRLRVSSPC